LRRLLRVRNFVNIIRDKPHAEERSKSAPRSEHDLDAGLCLPSPDLAFQASKNRGNSTGSTAVNTVAGCNASYVPPGFGARGRNW
jgi:hypothetical protein